MHKSIRDVAPRAGLGVAQAMLRIRLRGRLCFAYTGHFSGASVPGIISQVCASGRKPQSRMPWQRQTEGRSGRRLWRSACRCGSNGNRSSRSSRSNPHLHHRSHRSRSSHNNGSSICHRSNGNGSSICHRSSTCRHSSTCRLCSRSSNLFSLLHTWDNSFKKSVRETFTGDMR